ncbi:unnamed protein product [Bursaphelenchus okinawaensis]|uniref:BZIP domain-containing protein n=1 Tax=Bursaphelenchus okinawaensis TaxID=465554 RepID=A0A811KY53_9BILA|nr:unnamed protein product [Bursaphelenchus okinawaensis]CAG9114417.1 unnamed protein product [Bursaphelenchus okinawaensis]
MWSADVNNNLSNYPNGVNWSTFNSGKTDEYNSYQLLGQMNAHARGLYVNTPSMSASSSEISPPIRRKKKPCPVPAEKKDDAYVQRRQKNNLSAQKSREERKKREAEKDARIKELEMQVAQLCQQVFFLQTENAKYKCHLLQYGSAVPDSMNSTMNTSMNSTAFTPPKFSDLTY